MPRTGSRTRRRLELRIESAEPAPRFAERSGQHAILLLGGPLGRGQAPVRFCHRGYPASTETPCSINLVESALEPISPRSGVNRSERRILAGHTANPLGEPRMTSDAGIALPKKRTPPPTLPSSATPFRSAFLARRECRTRASSTSRCRMSDCPSAETLEWSCTVLP